MSPVVTRGAKTPHIVSGEETPCSGRSPTYLSAFFSSHGPAGCSRRAARKATPRVFFVAIYAKNPEKSRDFYVGLIGMTEVPPRRARSPGVMLNFTGSKADPFLMLIPTTNQQESSAEGRVLQRIALFVPDVAAAVNRVREAGYPVKSEPRQSYAGLPNTIISHVSDPDGNDVELVQD